MAQAAADAAQHERTVVYLGNRDAIEIIEETPPAGDEPIRVRRPLPEGKRCTTIVLAPGLTLMEAAYDITHTTRGVWQAHSDAAAPAWVASTDPVLAQLLASHWGCELRAPDPGQPGDTGAEG